MASTPAAGPVAPNDRTVVVTTAMLAAESSAYVPREHYLVLVEGWETGRRVKLGSAPLRFGRAADCDVVIPDPQVSGRHCEARLGTLDASLHIEDLGSTNGTFIGGQRVAGAATLPPGGLMRVGAQLWRHEHLTEAEVQRAGERRRELEQARHYVDSLLPAPLREGPILTDWCFVPSAQLGGDAFGYHWLDGSTFAVYLIDVSGHGVGAAMHSVSVMNVMRQRALPACDGRDPAQVLRSLNEMFQADAHDGMYFSAWYGVYDTRSKTLRYASGGHHPSCLVSADRATMTPLRTRNLVIGAAAGSAFVSAEAPVPEDATLYLFSDGVFEVQDRQGRQLGLPEFLPLLQQPAAAPGAEARRILEGVRAASRPGSFDDDFTLLAVTFSSSH